MEGLGTKNWMLELMKNRQGLKKHGNETNGFIEEWIYESKNHPIIKKINIFSLDFVYTDVCAKIVDLNFT